MLGFQYAEVVDCGWCFQRSEVRTVLFAPNLETFGVGGNDLVAGRCTVGLTLSSASASTELTALVEIRLNDRQRVHVILDQERFVATDVV